MADTTEATEHEAPRHRVNGPGLADREGIDMNKRTEDLALTAAMQEWADAIRGDWGDIDGRSVRGEVEDWIAALDGIEPYASWTLEQWRTSMGVCPRGEGHWTHHCAWIHAGVSR